MSTRSRILMVDDEPNVLAGYRRALGRQYDVTTAESGAEALDLLRAEPTFPVVFSDMRMPEMDGIAFLEAAKAAFPDSVYVMLTGNADQQTAIDAINQGSIFRFLTKPCPPEMLERTITACLKQYELVSAERVLLRNTLTGSVKLLVEALTLSDPILGASVARVHRDCQEIANAMNLPPDWRRSIAGSLCLLGCIVSVDRDQQKRLTDEFLLRCAERGATLLRHIPRLESVAQIIARQRETGPLPEDLTSANADDRIVINSRLLRFSVDWVRETRRTGDRSEAFLGLRARSSLYDARLIEAAGTLPGAMAPAPASASGPTKVSIGALTPGMITMHDVHSTDGKLLVPKGHTLTPMVIELLGSFESAGMVASTITVTIEASAPAVNEAA